MAGENIEYMFARYGPKYRYIVTIGGVIGTITVILSSTMVNVAVPSVMGTFGVGQDEAQWMATAFLATTTASQLLSAFVIAKFGTRYGYVGTMMLFVLGSMICAFSPTIDFLILGRVVQGAAAGILQPMVMVTMYKVFPVERRGVALSFFGMGIMIAPMLGPVIGGLTIDWLTWRHMFFVPLPIACLAMFISGIFMPERDEDAPIPNFDWPGFFLLVGGLFCIMNAIANGQEAGWSSNEIVSYTVVGLICTVFFIAWQLRSDSPLLDFSLFSNPQFAAAALLGFVFGAGNFATAYIIPVFVQSVQGFSPTESGLLIVPAGFVAVCAFSFTGRLTDVMSAHYLAMFGLCAFALSTAMFHSADVNTAFWTMALYVCAGRLGLSFMMPAINSSAMRSLRPEQLNRGSGTVNFIRQLGGAFGVNTLVVFMEQRTEFHSRALAATQTPGNISSREMLDRVAGLLGESGVPAGVVDSGALHYLGRVVEAQATTFGFKDGFIIITVVFICALIPAWILGQSRKMAS